jgi:type IV secretory pathway ATPase VirB11/archaellum biosynthesis ATPase
VTQRTVEAASPDAAPETLGDVVTLLHYFDAEGVAAAMDAIFDADQEARPSFATSWVVPTVPPGAELLVHYPVGDSEVRLYRLPDRTESLYYVVPAAYQLPIHHLKLIHLAKEELRSQPPRQVEFRGPEEARAYVAKRGEQVLYRLAKERALTVGRTRGEELATVKRLAEILAAYTAGLGIVEVLLRDDHVQDIYVDAPASRTPVYVTVSDMGEGLYQRCVTNVVLTEEDAEALLSRFRFASGRPFSEALPVLESNLEAFRARVTVVGKPLSPDGLAIALRRHSADPWTLPKLIHAGSLSPQAAGLLSFLIDGRSTLLVAGSRGAGKTALLGALLLEFPRSQRILTIEDTLELPAPQMQALGYKVQSLFVQSTLGGPAEMTADEALRVSLRLGESALVLGEVRGQEARTLYEAMRAGTAGSAVLGTIHGNSSRAVYERIVHDLGIPPMAFSATDVVVIAGLARPGGSQRQLRRVTEVAEVAKRRGPGEFDRLLAYDAAADVLRETDTYRRTSARIGAVAEAWGLTYAEALDNIAVRGTLRGLLVDAARTEARYDLLAAEWVARANARYWALVEEGFEGRTLVEEWRAWLAEAMVRG